LYEEIDGALTKYYSIACMIVAMNDGSGMKYLLTDHLGSMVAITNADGGLISHQRYVPFGQLRDDVQSPYLYTGQRNLPDIGLMDYRVRFYDSAVAKCRQHRQACD
jgi:hypothetical protein